MKLMFSSSSSSFQQGVLMLLLLTIAANSSPSSLCCHAFVPPTSLKTTPPTTATQRQQQQQSKRKVLPLTAPLMSPSSSSSSSSSTNNNPSLKEMAYGESSRQYRRTVYNHNDWVKHRSSNRFARYVIQFFDSGIYKNIAKEVMVTVLISTFVVIWNGFIDGGFTNFAGMKQAPIFGGGNNIPKMKISLIPFTLASPFLGLILVFRTNAAYKRWDEARKAWGQNINHTRDLIRMGNSFYDVDDSDNNMNTPTYAKSSSLSSSNKEEQKQLKRSYDLQHLNLCTWAFVRSMKRHLSPDYDDEINFQEELLCKLPNKEQALNIINAQHRPNRALHDLSLAIENLPMHFLRKNLLHTSIKKFEDNLGTSERLLFTPVPIFYNRHTARFLTFWLLLLPLALYDGFKCTWNHIGLIPTTAMMSLIFFGIEELATQMEEPFTILPMQTFCDKIYNWCTEICSFKDGDNGIITRKLPSTTYQNYL